MTLHSIEPRFVEFIPTELQPGTLYVSMVYTATSHLCACDCGNKVVLPLSPAEWQLHFDGESVSLTPSIGNWEFPCRSYYWIRTNKIRWATPWTKSQIAADRKRGAQALDAYVAGRTSGVGLQPADQASTLRGRIRLALRRPFRR